MDLGKEEKTEKEEISSDVKTNEEAAEKRQKKLSRKASKNTHFVCNERRSECPNKV
jgi:hypothetical protein